MTWGRLPHVEPASPFHPFHPFHAPTPGLLPPPKSPRGWPVFCQAVEKREVHGPWPTAGGRVTKNTGAARKNRWIPRGGAEMSTYRHPLRLHLPPNFFASTSASPGKQDRRQAVFVFRGPARSLKPQHWGSLVSTTGHVRDMAIRNTECRAICGRACSGSRECWLGSAGSSSQPAARS